MTTATIIRTLFEVLAILLVAYAIYKEDRVSEFEGKLIKAIKYYNHKHKRLKAQKQVKKNRAFILAVDNSHINAPVCESKRAVG